MQAVYVSGLSRGVNCFLMYLLDRQVYLVVLARTASNIRQSQQWAYVVLKSKDSNNKMEPGDLSTKVE